MSTYLAFTHMGHLEQVVHVFGYLKANPKINIFFDPHHTKIDKRSFAAHDWYEIYRYAKEAIPADAPNPRVNVVSAHCFVDAYHAGNTANRISQTRVLIFVNKDPILWCSKQ